MSTKVLGPDGVQQIYPTAQGGTEFYLNMSNPYQGGAYTSRSSAQFNISYGTGSQFPFSTHSENGLTFFNTTGSPITYASGSPPGRSVRLDVYPDGGKWANKTNFSWENNQGYLYTQNGIGSGEFTVYIRVHGDLGTHQAFAGKIGGRDEDSIRSLIEMVYPTATHSEPQLNYNYAHFPYVNAKPQLIGTLPKLADNGKWIGMKVVHFIADDKKSSDWELWADIDPFDANGKPQNNWVKAATYHDTGVSGYKNIPLTWKSHKDLCRVDGFKNVDFTLISDREVTQSTSPTPTPNPTPTPTPVPTPTPTPTPTPSSDTRYQVRQTATPGDPVPDADWTIISDTGPLGGPPPVPTPTPTPIPTPTPTGSVDQFGVKKLYADGPGPATYMNMDDPTKTFGAGPGDNPEGSSSYYPKFTKNSDGSWKNTNGKEVRWAWCAEGTYPGDSNICKCYDTNNKTGTMGNPGDWPARVEMTGYYRSPPGSATSNKSNGETHLEHVIGGHRSTTSSTASGPGGCDLGCAGSYHGNKYPLTGRQKWEKDYHHSFAYAKDISGVNNSTATPKWTGDNLWHGFKDIFYILPDGKTVQLESWTDWNADGNWKKTHSFQDDGLKWVPKAAYSGCGSGPQTIQFLFNGPLVDFRADNWSSVGYDMKWLSIRSIDPTKPLHTREEHARTFEAEDYVNPDDEIYQNLA